MKQDLVNLRIFLNLKIIKAVLFITYTSASYLVDGDYHICQVCFGLLKSLGFVAV